MVIGEGGMGYSSTLMNGKSKFLVSTYISATLIKLVYHIVGKCALLLLGILGSSRLGGFVIRSHFLFVSNLLGSRFLIWESTVGGWVGTTWGQREDNVCAVPN